MSSLTAQLDAHAEYHLDNNGSLSSQFQLPELPLSESAIKADFIETCNLL